MKRVEFRRRAFTKAVETVFLYSTGRGGGLVGLFRVKAVHKLSPKAAWRRYRRVAGIARKAFFAYYTGSATAVCIEVRRVSRARRRVTRKHLGAGFGVPQSFRYLSDSKSRRLEAALGVSRGHR